MTSALIGYSGFVGANLARDEAFDLLINRANLESLRGARLTRLVCSGLPAAKWIANQRPNEDAENIRRLQGTLSTVRAERFVLISTIDVYPRTRNADETYDGMHEPAHPYGKHRFEFERFVRDQFPHAHIVRLPALFGWGLKKNIVYDLLQGNQLERINPASWFQWYPVSRLTQDLRTVEIHELPVVNLFTEPVETRDILGKLFEDKVVGQAADPPVHYDLHTRYGAMFGGDSRYVMSAAQVVSSLAEFVRMPRSHQ